MPFQERSKLVALSSISARAEHSKDMSTFAKCTLKVCTARDPDRLFARVSCERKRVLKGPVLTQKLFLSSDPLQRHALPADMD